MAGRGVVRRSKSRKPHIRAVTEDDKEPESLKTLTDKKVRALENKAVSYLEEELRILTSTPGNFSEVARILKILEARTQVKGGKSASVRSESSEKIESWSLDD